MDNILLFETENQHLNLLPLSYTRPIADFRVGILTIREKWERYMPGAYSYRAVEYLSYKFPAVYAESNLYVNAALLPSPELVEAIRALGEGEALVKSGTLLAARGGKQLLDDNQWNAREFYQSVDMIEYLFDVFGHNAQEIERDYQLLTAGRESAPLSETNIVIGPKRDAQGRQMIFLEEGASVEAATLNTNSGPIYIGASATVMEGSNLRGTIALCEHATINMGSKIYPGTTIGPHCKVGGEINNAVIFGFSNKAHDGYLGNAVVGEWCNIGAGTNASNLKNDYSKIRIWNYAKRTFMRTDLQFCGLMMGDHSKIGINGMLNTATVIGVGVNLHGSGFPRVFIPSFSQGSPSGGFTDVPLNKFFDIAERAMARRAIKLTDEDKALFECIARKAAEFK
jgi:UDP-N-acetylglucosamine diphosphorylase/glucosamine-1-phosphate N-acetyltransferase